MSEKMQDKMFWQGEGFYKNTQRQNTNGEWRTEWEYTTYPVGTWFDEPDPECDNIFMNEGVEEPQQEETYEITSELFGDGSATLAEIESMVEGWNDWNEEGWEFEVKLNGGKVRVYASRISSEEPQPHDGENWVMFTNDEGFLDIAND